MEENDEHISIMHKLSFCSILLIRQFQWFFSREKSQWLVRAFLFIFLNLSFDSLGVLASFKQPVELQREESWGPFSYSYLIIS